MSSSPVPEPGSPALEAALATLRGGGVVAYPSETVWGLAAHPEVPQAIRRLYTLKGRAADKAVQVSCQDAAVALTLARPSAALEALSALWPGPLTLVTPARPGVPVALAPGGLIGLRVPAHPLALALLRAAGGVLVTTSCNPSGEPPALSEAQATQMEIADLVLPAGQEQSGGQASTVVQLPELRVLRTGAVGEALLRATLAAAGVEAAP